MNIFENYRPLTTEQITLLESQGCRATSWESLRVSTGFDPRYVRQVSFVGENYIGATGLTVSDPAGVERPSGLYEAVLSNCRIGDGVLIHKVGRYIANYDIEAGVQIESVGQISCEGSCSFGVGTEVATINEGGGREVPIFVGMTAQQAYILALYRHRTQTQASLRKMIEELTERATSTRGVIGAGAVVVHVTTIVGVRIGEGAVVDGAQDLRRGTISSSFSSPTYVGSGVTARDFILSPSSKVDTGSLLRSCFVGEGVLIENGFSAENSLFFSNCHCTHGEACAVFAGPYTVSHHRSSLLIAGYFSFFNAGSGANQSNHMYKSGPVHQGVHLRGCKFGSDAYVLLPAVTGLFTLVSGRHYNHHDTDLLPFSYLIEEGGESYLIPGVNLRSFGTARDVAKWPNRDRRVGVSSDLIHYGMYSPYSVGKLIQAVGVCRRLMERYPLSEEVTWNRVKIKMSSLKKGVQLYQRALRSYFSAQLSAVGSAFLEPGCLPTAEQMERVSEWVDLSGMIAPKVPLRELLERVDRGEICSMEELEEQLRALYECYPCDEQTWLHYALSRYLDTPLAQISSEQIAELIAQGEQDQKALDEAIAQDAKRDSAPMMSVGYGIDSEEFRQADFWAVRGE